MLLNRKVLKHNDPKRDLRNIALKMSLKNSAKIEVTLKKANEIEGHISGAVINYIDVSQCIKIHRMICFQSRIHRIAKEMMTCQTACN